MPPKAIHFITEFPVAVRSARYTGKLFATPHRSRGRRIVVFDGQTPVFDTNDHMDLCNATNSLHNWMQEQAKAKGAVAAPA
jgi:hypothetical protein